MENIDYFVDSLIKRIRAHASDNDQKIQDDWKEITRQINSIDISFVVSEQRGIELKHFNEWLSGVDPCTACEKELPRLEMYAYGKRLLQKVEYHLRGSNISRNANGACYECQKNYIDTHTFPCVDCGSSYFRTNLARRSPQVRCESCQSKETRIVPQKSRARKLGLATDLTHTQWDETLSYFNHKCVYCGRSYEIIEHFTPVTSGGGTSARNCVPACQSCNISKGGTDGRTEAEKLALRLKIPIERIQAIAQYLDSR